MNKNIYINALSYSWVLASVISITLLAVSIAYAASFFTNTIHQTYFIIITFTLGLGIINLILKKQIIKVRFLFNDRNMRIEENTFSNPEKQSEVEIPYSEVIDYNTYTLTTKKIGRIIRIKTNRKEYLYYLNWISVDNKDKFKDIEFHEIETILRNRLRSKKKYTFKDIGMVLLGIAPWIVIIISILTVIISLTWFFQNPINP